MSMVTSSPGPLPGAQDGCPCGSPALTTVSPHGACQLSGSASSGFSEQQPGFSLSSEPSCHHPRGSGTCGEDTMFSPLSFAHRAPPTVPPVPLASCCWPLLRGAPSVLGLRFMFISTPHPEKYALRLSFLNEE